MAPVTSDIQGLKFGHREHRGHPQRLGLRLEHHQDLVGLIDDDQASALLVRSADLDLFRRIADVVIDRKRKDPRKSLAGYLLGLGRDKVPLIEGSYSSAGQLKRSLRELLAKAVGTSDGRLFVVGAGDALFQDLWDSAGGPDVDAVPGERRSAAPAYCSPISDDELFVELRKRSRIAPELATRFVGASREAQRIRALVGIASQNSDSVLITGESGTGKEVVAREIHRLGARRNESFIPVNCGAIPGDLFESELFGHRRGSFTGAVADKDGLWRKADRGTLFLDEVGDLALPHQAKILRALEDGLLRPVGATEEIKVSARILAATNRNLTDMVATGTFREDLYYRLRSFTIPTSPLRDHVEDIPVIAATFWREIAGEAGQPLSGEILAALSAYRWPGNARELKTTLRQLHAMFAADDLEARHLRLVFHHLGQDAPGLKEPAGDGEVERFHGECLHHLRRVMDVLQAVQRALRRLGESPHGRPRGTLGARPARVSEAERSTRLALHRDELDRLCAKPLLFAGEETFRAVSRFKDALGASLIRRPKTAAGAGAHREEALGADCAAAISAVFKAVESLR